LGVVEVALGSMNSKTKPIQMMKKNLVEVLAALEMEYCNSTVVVVVV
jgi:hypothetical protein